MWAILWQSFLSLSNGRISARPVLHLATGFARAEKSHAGHTAAVPEYTAPLVSGPFALPCRFLSRDLMYMWSSLFSCLHARGCLSQASCLGHLALMSASVWWFITKGWQEWIGRTVERQVFPQRFPTSVCHSISLSPPLTLVLSQF